MITEEVRVATIAKLEPQLDQVPGRSLPSQPPLGSPLLMRC